MKNLRKFETAARPSGKRLGITLIATNKKQKQQKRKNYIMKISIKSIQPGIMALVAAAGVVIAFAPTASKAQVTAFNASNGGATIGSDNSAFG